nr:iron-sulfur cluster assembly protein [Coraliomargarita akajimensis]
MDYSQTLSLSRDTRATIIPAGDPVVLPAGTEATITQALGGTVTIRTNSGLFRLTAQEWDSLGVELAAQLAAEAEAAEKTVDGERFSEDIVWEAMKGCFDPEIPVNIVDLGLVYDLRCTPATQEGQYEVAVKMTLTAQGCGMGPVIADDAKQRIEALASVSSASVDIVWDPPWTPHMISPEGRQRLGLE